MTASSDVAVLTKRQKLREILERGTFKKSDLMDRLLAAIDAFKTNWNG